MPQGQTEVYYHSAKTNDNSNTIDRNTALANHNFPVQPTNVCNRIAGGDLENSSVYMLASAIKKESLQRRLQLV